MTSALRKASGAMKNLDGITAEKAAEAAKPLVSAVGNLIAVNSYASFTL